MKLVIEILSHAGDERVTHCVIEKFPATVGRGFQNDVILTDPHVSPQHLRIDCADGGWSVSDLESANGVEINQVVRLFDKGAGLPIRSGDVIRIGQTELRLYDPHHPVVDTVRIQKFPPVFSWLSRPVNVWACFLLAVAIIQGWSFLEIWTEEPGMVLAAAATGTAGIVLVWAALWSVAGRLIRHRSHFGSHAAIMCLYLTAGTLSWYIEAYGDFLTNEHWLAASVAYGVNFILLVVLLYGSLALATRMAQMPRLFSAVIVSGAALGGIFALSLISAKNFNQQPLYPATLEPYLSWLVPADGIDEFMIRNEKLFSLRALPR